MNPRKEVLTALDSAVRAKFADILVSGRTLNEPSSYPALSVVLYDAPQNYRAQDSRDTEVATDLSFQVIAYSNKKKGSTSYAMTECEEIIQAVNETMCALGFRRSMQQPIDTVADDGVYKIVCRYSGTATDTHFYWR